LIFSFAFLVFEDIIRGKRSSGERASPGIASANEREDKRREARTTSGRAGRKGVSTQTGVEQMSEQNDEIKKEGCCCGGHSGAEGGCCGGHNGAEGGCCGGHNDGGCGCGEKAEDFDFNAPLPKPTLVTIATTFAQQAMVSMGILPNPMTGKSVFMMNQAAYFIDAVDLLLEKTEGNRSEMETRTLENVAHELRMLFVEANKEKARREAEGTTK
jgi:hypothetical protein